MIFSKKNHDLIRQNEKVVKKPHKHDANLQKNSSLYFQIGLILCLVCAYGLLEMSFQAKDYSVETLAHIETNETFDFNKPIQVYEEIIAAKPKVKTPVVFKEPVIKKNEDPIIETPVVVNKTTSDIPPIKIENVTVVDVPEDVNIMLVEQVPVYPGCESASSKDARRQCMSEKIGKFIQRKFDTRKGADLGLVGIQKIYVNFRINKFGDIEILETSAPHEKLAKEANRVVNKLPKMIPGQHGNKKVDVLYTLPIIFQIKN